MWRVLLVFLSALAAIYLHSAKIDRRVTDADAILAHAPRVEKSVVLERADKLRGVLSDNSCPWRQFSSYATALTSHSLLWSAPKYFGRCVLVGPKFLDGQNCGASFTKNTAFGFYSANSTFSGFDISALPPQNPMMVSDTNVILAGKVLRKFGREFLNDEQIAWMLTTMPKISAPKSLENCTCKIVRWAYVMQVQRVEPTQQTKNVAADEKIYFEFQKNFTDKQERCLQTHGGVYLAIKALLHMAEDLDLENSNSNSNSNINNDNNNGEKKRRNVVQVDSWGQRVARLVDGAMTWQASMAQFENADLESAAEVYERISRLGGAEVACSIQGDVLEIN